MIDIASLVTIRPACLSDVPAIEELHRASVRELAASYYPPDLLERFLAAGTLDRGLVDAGTYYLAEIVGLPVGSGGWMAVDDRPEGAWRARIRSVFVHPRWARHGIGRRLVLNAETEATRAGFTHFELEATLAGMPLYQHLGYREVQHCGYPLPDGTTLPVIRMEKALTRMECSASGSPEARLAEAPRERSAQSITCWPPSMPSTSAVT
jgi:GNAT superfamily N-acetyltransferase